METILNFLNNVKAFLHSSSVTLILQYVLIFFFIALLARFFFGRDSGLKNAIFCALSVMMLYVFAALAYRFIPVDLSRYLNRLPLGHFSGSSTNALLTLTSLPFSNLNQLCSLLLRIFILSVIMNLMNMWAPNKQKLLAWVAVHILYLAAAVLLNYFICGLISRYLPFLFQGYVPMIVLLLLFLSFGLGSLKLLLTVALTVVNPLFGILYGFFFRNPCGKSISRAIGSTIAISVVLFALNRIGYHTLAIGSGSLSAYIPLALSTFVLWIIAGRAL